MTAKRDGRSKPKKERPKIKKETLRDLTPNHDDVVGGKGMCTGLDTGCAHRTEMGCSEVACGTSPGCG